MNGRRRQSRKFPTRQIADLGEALQLPTLPFLVEARDWARLTESFHNEIVRDYVILR